MKIDNHPFTKAFIRYVRDNNLTTINALLESLKKLPEDDTSNKIKGNVTEGLARWFFLTHPFYQHWTCNYTAKNAKGIDLILFRVPYKKHACQVKFRKSETISEEDLGTFGTHTWLEGYAGGIIFSNVLEVPEIFRNNDKVICILKHDILKRNNDLLDIVAAAEGSQPKPYAAKKPWKLQIDAVKSLEDTLPSKKRGKYLSPPGTGKTFVQSEFMRILLGSGERIFASFAPTIKLVNQNADNFYKQLTALGYGVELLVVNSGQRSGDANIVPTTDYLTVRKFLRKASLDRRRNVFYIVSCCYASCDLLAKAWRYQLPKRGVALFDEAHNLAGLDEKTKTQLVTNGFFPSKRKYFFTATEKVYDGDRDDIIAMNHDEFGKTLYEISVRQAIEAEMIKDYKLVTVGVDAKFVNKYWDALNENAFALMCDDKPVTFYEVLLKVVLYKAVKKLGLRRPILHFNVISNAVRMNEYLTMEDDITKFFGFTMNSEVVYSDLGGRVIDERIFNYINRDKSVLCATQLLSEGVDIEGENGERPDSTMFCDNRKSTISIWQSAGRGLRLDKTDPTAISHIIVPIVDGGDEKVFNDCMETIKNVLTSIALNDEAVRQELTVLANGKKRPKKGYKLKSKHVDLDVEFTTLNVSMKDILDSVDLRVRINSSKNWTTEELKAAILEHPEVCNKPTYQKYYKKYGWPTWITMVKIFNQNHYEVLGWRNQLNSISQADLKKSILEHPEVCGFSTYNKSYKKFGWPAWPKMTQLFNQNHYQVLGWKNMFDVMSPKELKKSILEHPEVCNQPTYKKSYKKYGWPSWPTMTQIFNGNHLSILHQNRP